MNLPQYVVCLVVVVFCVTNIATNHAIAMKCVLQLNCHRPVDITHFVCLHDNNNKSKFQFSRNFIVTWVNVFKLSANSMEHCLPFLQKNLLPY